MPSAIAIIRLSGKGCHQLLKRCVRFFSPETLQPRLMHRCEVVDPSSGQVIDDGLCVLFVGPSSYTGEDAAELFIHGGLYLADRITEILLSHGFQLAEPGEFTQRAYLAGKIDLTQAEGIRELTQSSTKSQWQVARAMAQGDLKEHIETLRSDLVQCLALLEAAMDFPEEPDTRSLGIAPQRLESIRRQIIKLQKSYRSGQIAREGLRVVLCGRANAGKSSLMNALCAKDRAIVTDAPGTTRDYLEESVLMEGRMVVLVDTAGLRDPDDMVEEAESIAVGRTLDLARQADRILLLQPTHLPPLQPSLFEGSDRTADPQILSIRSFADKPAPSWARPSDIVLSLPPGGKPMGVEKIKQLLIAAADASVESLEGRQFICTPRQKKAVDDALARVDDALVHLGEGLFEEIIASDLQKAAYALSSIIGQITTDDLLDQVFSQFCLGK